MYSRADSYQRYAKEHGTSPRTPKGLRHHQSVELKTGVVNDNPPFGHSFGDVLEQPLLSYPIPNSINSSSFFDSHPSPLSAQLPTLRSPLSPPIHATTFVSKVLISKSNAILTLGSGRSNVRMVTIRLRCVGQRQASCMDRARLRSGGPWNRGPRRGCIGWCIMEIGRSLLRVKWRLLRRSRMSFMLYRLAFERSKARQRWR